jgi:hypothetical protein
MEALDKAVTDVRAIHITKAADTVVVTARAEQIPRIWRVIGLLSTSGSTRIFLASLMMHPPLEFVVV